MGVPVPGTNSWATLAEANAYFADKWGAAATWAGLTNTQKSQLLITAYHWLMSMSEYSLSPADTSDQIKRAQFEAAWYLYNYSANMEKRRALYAQGVRSFKVSEFSESLAEAELPLHIAGLLDGYRTGGGSMVSVSRTEEVNGGDGTVGR